MMTVLCVVAEKLFVRMHYRVSEQYWGVYRDHTAAAAAAEVAASSAATMTFLKRSSLLITFWDTAADLELM